MYFESFSQLQANPQLIHQIDYEIAVCRCCIKEGDYLEFLRSVGKIVPP